MAGKSGGAWKVAYADFVTAMMAFFMVMWISGQDKSVKQAIAHYFEDPYATATDAANQTTTGAPGAGVFETGRGPGRGWSATNTRGPGNGAGGEGTSNKPPRLMIYRDASRTRGVGTIVLFPTAGTALDQTADERLESLAPLLAGMPNVIEIRAHISAPSATDANAGQPWNVAQGRCLSIMQCLEKHGIERERFRLSQSTTREPHVSDPELGSVTPDNYVEVFAVDEYLHRN